MKWLKLSLFVLAALLLIIIAAGAWLFYTTSGARFAMKAVSYFTAAEIKTASLEGRLGGRLTLTNLSATVADTHISADKVLIAMNPLQLLTANIAIETLFAEDVRVIDKGPEKKGDGLSWPAVSGLPLRMRARIGDLRVKDLRYEREGEEPLVVDSLSARVVWDRGELAVRDMAVVTQGTEFTGRITAGFEKPSLDVDVQVATPKESAPGDTRDGSGPGAVPTRRSSRSRESAGDGARTDESRAQPAKKANLSAEGRPGDEGINPSISVHLSLKNFRIERFTGIEAVLNGQVRITGTLADYKGTFTVTTAEENWKALEATGAFTGGEEHLNLESLKAQWLGGQVTGEGTVNWKDGTRLAVEVRARDLDPERIDPTWEGNINANALLKARVPETGAASYAVDARLLESTFRGRTVQGAFEAQRKDDTLRLSNLDLHGKGFDINASGVLSKRIKFSADVADLSAFLPGGRGELSAKGWVRYRDGDLALEASGKGSEMLYRDLNVGALRFDAGLDEGRKKPIKLDFVAAGVSYGGVDLRRASARISGTMPDHTIRLSASEDNVELSATLSGGYGEGVWKGRVRTLRGTGLKRGDWRLTSPARLILAREQIRLESLTMRSTRRESIEADVDLRLGPMDGSVGLDWKGFDLARAARFLPVDTAGTTTGRLKMRWNEGEVALIVIDTALSGRVQYKEARFVVSRGNVRLNWDEENLKANWTVTLDEGGEVRGKAASPLGARLCMPDTISVGTEWEQLALPLFNPLIGPDVRLEGVAAGRFQGELLPGEDFSVDLTATVRDGRVTLTREERKVEVPLQPVTLKAQWKGTNLDGSLFLDGAAKGGVKTNFTLPLPANLPLAIDESGRIMVDAEANLLDLSLLAPFLPPSLGKPQGRVQVTAHAKGTWSEPVLNAVLELAGGSVYLQPAEATIEGVNAQGKLSWDRQGLAAVLRSSIRERGNFQARVTSAEQPRMGLPDTAQLAARWNNVRLSTLSPFLPGEMKIEGAAFGTATGRLLPGRKVEAALETSVENGQFLWVGEGAITAAIRSAGVSAALRDNRLTGRAAINLSQYGRVSADFSLPVLSALPPAPIPSGPVNVSLKGQLREQGLVTAFFPGLVQNTRGRIALDVRVLGTWAAPVMEGEATLADAGAYLPPAGITIENISTQLRFSGDVIDIVSLRAESGPGSVGGTGRIWLKNWSVDRYEAKLTGERFRAVFLPDLRLLVTPDLTLEGEGRTVSVRGNVLVPQLLIYGPPTEDVVRESPDVIIMNVKAEEEGPPPVELTAVIKVILGDDVIIKMRGLDAKLDGSVILKVAGFDDVAANGQINVVRGSYSTYGIKLDITKGQILLAGPVEQASLNVLAVREVKDDAGEVQTAGVQVTGTVRKPVIDLYSQPALPDAEVLSYVLFGKPLTGDIGETSLLMRAAGALLSRGESVSFQEKLKRTFGLEMIDIEAGAGQTEEAMITVGRYLTPDLYVSFGRSLFTSEYVFRLRYSLTKRWEIETMTGGESGGDIYYKIEFD